MKSLTYPWQPLKELAKEWAQLSNRGRHGSGGLALDFQLLPSSIWCVKNWVKSYNFSSWCLGLVLLYISRIRSIFSHKSKVFIFFIKGSINLPDIKMIRI